MWSIVAQVTDIWKKNRKVELYAGLLNVSWTFKYFIIVSAINDEFGEW